MLKAHLERNLAQAEALGQQERAKKLKERIADLKEKPKKPAKKAPAKKSPAKPKS